jgi:hypothetical protein
MSLSQFNRRLDNLESYTPGPGRKGSVFLTTTPAGEAYQVDPLSVSPAGLEAGTLSRADVDGLIADGYLVVVAVAPEERT